VGCEPRIEEIRRAGFNSLIWTMWDVNRFNKEMINQAYEFDLNYVGCEPKEG